MQKVGDELLKSQLKIEAGRIALLEEGKKKRIAMLQQEHDETVAEINSWEKDQLSEKGVTPTKTTQRNQRNRD